MAIYIYNSIYNPDPFTLEFTYTWSDQRYTVPYTWSYGTAWAWGTQTWRWSWWNAWANQFNWWNGWWTYGYGWGWWWWWWNGSQWDGSSDDDRWGWWGSGYVLSTATDRVLTQWWWSASWQNGKVVLSFIG